MTAHPARLVLLVALLAVLPSVGPASQTLTLPNRSDSVRFLVIGDSGTGGRAQRELAADMTAYRARFPFTFAIMLGDNLYGSERPHDYARKFEAPYRRLLDVGVEFNAALGNHDELNQRFYAPFHLGGQRYRTFTKGNAQFFVLDTNYLDPTQMQWLQDALVASTADWKIAYFHHPIYTAATRGPSLDLRAVLEPLFVEQGVDVVFAGHEHLYERLKPQRGVQYFVAGGAAKLRRGDLRASPETAVGFDRDQTFMLVEIAGDQLAFQTIARRGLTVDKGVITRNPVDP